MFDDRSFTFKVSKSLSWLIKCLFMPVAEHAVKDCVASVINLNQNTRSLKQSSDSRKYVCVRTTKLR